MLTQQRTKNTKHVGVVLQARMGSTRLPGKVMLHVDGQPLLSFILRRLKRLQRHYTLIVATTHNSLDDIIEITCQSEGVTCYRGEEHDVLERFSSLSQKMCFTHIVRLTADSPFIDADFVESQIQKYFAEVPHPDYASTILNETYPLGFHVEIMTQSTLKHANLNCNNPEYREHVTPYIYNHPNKFSLHSLENKENYSHIRLTVDYKEDLIFTNNLIKEIYHFGYDINLSNILLTLQKMPSLLTINQHISKKQKITYNDDI